MFCIACGKQIADDSLFCEHCGAKQEPPPPPVRGPVREPAAEQTPGPPAPAPGGEAPFVPLGTPAPIAAERKPMSPKAKGALIALAAIAAVLVGAKLILGALFTPEKTIEKFLAAYQSGDADAFRATVTVTEDRLELTDEVLAPFFNSYKGSEKDAYVRGLREALMRDALSLQQGTPGEGDGFVRLTEKSYVLFSTYSVELTPLEVQISSEFENTAVEVGAQSYTVDSEPVSAFMLPGVYDVAAAYTDPDTGVTLKAQMSSRAVNRWDNYIDIYFDYTSVYIEGDASGLSLKEIQVDGRTYTGDLSGADLYNGFEIGPVNFDSKIKVVTEGFGMEFEQELDVAQEGGYCYIYPEFSEEVERQALDTVATVLPDWFKTVYNYDRAALKRLSDSGAMDATFLADLDAYVSDAWNSAGIVFYVQLESIEARKNEGILYPNIGEVCALQVEIPLVFSGVSGYMFLSDGTFEESDVLEDAQYTGNVNLVYQDGRWIVTGAIIF